ncbi:MAG: DUF559 domain-containing protein [Marinilabiliaceae bacterium]|nr:DUF559 domain-containing protein [Marinilabiliaceae bacterium]
MSQENFDNLFYGANADIRRKAKNLRQNITHAEKLLWVRLRNRKLCGLKFRRQHPIYFFIADFYCHEKKLVIEVDGEIHKFRRTYDEARTAELERLGIKVIRFTNDQVVNNMKEVLKHIQAVCETINASTI